MSNLLLNYVAIITSYYRPNSDLSTGSIHFFTRLYTFFIKSFNYLSPCLLNDRAHERNTQKIHWMCVMKSELKNAFDVTSVTLNLSSLYYAYLMFVIMHRP